MVSEENRRLPGNHVFSFSLCANAMLTVMADFVLTFNMILIPTFRNTFSESILDLVECSWDKISFLCLKSNQFSRTFDEHLLERPPCFVLVSV